MKCRIADTGRVPEENVRQIRPQPARATGALLSLRFDPSGPAPADVRPPDEEPSSDESPKQDA